MAALVALTQEQSNSATVRNTILDADGSTLPSPPFAKVEGVPNFRDLGGHKCPDDAEFGVSRCIRYGYLFRSAQPAHITSTGIDTLTKELNIHDTYDLRSFKELRLMQQRYDDLSVEIPGVTRHHVPIYRDEDYTPISMVEKYNTAQADTSSMDQKLNKLAGRSKDGFIQAYGDILVQAAKSGSYRTIVQHILEHPDKPLLVHCTVGKDRTGVFIALLLKLCGVSDEAVVWDYALTTSGLGKWREHLIKRILDGAGKEYSNKGHDKDEQEGSGVTREQAERIVGSHAEDMEIFLEIVLKGKFGGARKYLREECGLKDEELDKVVDHLTIEGEGADFAVHAAL
ncbi:hypothetical protein LTR78_000149 [Recurvomyces mirabilis]|uniref:Tyrosine specific protein phosphatases domain-containing protein n=1 Tax=Recurvomyces mirabilis TaxID=574656 RepID=A0AAE1C698_9PEZI|nr:hypothetical protein LTR78_000149 [Recurvomyces mirabilis]KAK5161806.1 hypothetical protein LTS14_000151 [Recurvomyces mirabilis]